VGVDNEGDNKHDEVAYGHHVDEEADVDVDTCMGYLQGAHLEDDSVGAEVGDKDTLQELEGNVDTVVELMQIVMDDGHRVVEEDALMSLDCRDQLTTDSETQVVDLALSPLIASSTPVALQLQLISLFRAVEIYVVWLSTNGSLHHYQIVLVAPLRCLPTYSRGVHAWQLVLLLRHRSILPFSVRDPDGSQTFPYIASPGVLVSVLQSLPIFFHIGVFSLVI